MIIKKITVSPFAGLANQSVSFTSSLNVVMGPNEAGKSTLQKALWFSLFIPTNLKPKELQKFESVMFPANGGDHAEVELMFDVNGQEYILKKRWGAAHQSILHLPDGTLLRNEDGVTDKMLQLAGLSKATYSNVIFTFQSALGQTVNDLKKSTEVQQELANVLRNAIIAQGGVNIDHLKHELDGTIDEYDLNWDIKLNRPANGKDIDNPYKRDIGKILGSYYKYRNLEQQLKTTQEYERKLDKLISAAEGIASNLRGVDNFLDENAKALADAKAMDKISHEINKALHIRETLRDVYKKWPGLNPKLSFEEETIKRLTGDIACLSKERESALLREGAASWIEKHKQATAKRVELEKATQRLSQLPAVTDDIAQKANGLDKRLQEIKIELAAQKLQIQLQASTTFEGSFTSGGNASKTVYLQAGQQMNEEVVGCFSMSNDALTFTVKSCAVEAGQLLVDSDLIDKELTELLNKSKAESLSELLAHAKAYKEAQENVVSFQKELKAILNGNTFEILSQKVSEINKLPQTRSSKDIQVELDRCNLEIGSARKSVVQIQGTIKEYEKEFTSLEEVMEKGLSVKQQLEELQNALKQITALPEGFAKAEEFIAHYEQMEKTQKELRQKYTQLIIDRKELEKEEPESSSSELSADLGLAKAEHTRIVDEYKAYLLIREELTAILASIHSQTFNPLYGQTKAYLSDLTCAKYSEIAMEETVPIRIGSNGSALPTELLSKGTMDSLALALRLAMAEHYLAGQKGFLILDDPLVDMDAQRQQAASEVLNKYAQSKQIIMFTCHSNYSLIDELKIIKL